jgi:hypothetical protein
MATKQRPPFYEIFLLAAIRVRRDDHQNPPPFDEHDHKDGENSQVAIYPALTRLTLKTATADWLIAQNAARKFKQSDYDEVKEQFEDQARRNAAGKKKKLNSSAESSEAETKQPKTRRAS